MRLKMLCAMAMLGGLLAAAAEATTLTPLSLEQLAVQAPVAVIAEVTAAPDTVTGDGSNRLATRRRTYGAFQGSGFFLTGFNWSMEMRFLPPAGATNVVIGRP
jgi:hypothetical protein